MLRALRLNPRRNPDPDGRTPVPQADCYCRQMNPPTIPGDIEWLQMTGHHPGCWSAPASATSPYKRVRAERGAQLEEQSLLDQVRTLENLVEVTKRRMSVPRGSESLRDYNATVALEGKHLAQDMASLEEAKARLASFRAAKG